MNVTVRFLSLQAIFELSRGEQDLIEDLKLARKVCPFQFFLLEHLKQTDRISSWLCFQSQIHWLASFLHL